MKNPKTILITGASSGLGREFALQYAAAENTLFLTGRNEERLARVGRECLDRGGRVEFKSMDITDARAVSEWVLNCDRSSPVDLAIANAGVSGGSAAGEGTDQVKTIFATNVDGVINTIQPLLPKMKERRRGQLAIVSSLASFRGMPGAPAYSASKAAVRVYGEALRGLLYAYGVEVTVVAPGYIKTPMTESNAFFMPFLMGADRAVRIIKKRLAKNPARIAFPLPMYLAVWLLGALPPWLTDPVLRKMPKKR